MKLKVNNIYTLVEYDSYEEQLLIKKQLSKYLSIRVPGYQFTQAYKRKGWDGYKSYYTFKKFYTGFLAFVLKYVQESFNIEPEIIDSRENLVIQQTDIVTEIAGNKLRDYQLEAVASTNRYLSNGLYFPRGVIDNAPNAGKTLIIAALYEQFNRPETLYLIHNETIMQQVINEFKKIGEVGIINAKEIRLHNITVAMYKTLLNRLKDERYYNLREWISSVKLLMIDEVHHAGAQEYTELLSMINAGVRVGLSGTSLKNEDVSKNMNIVGLTSSLLHSVSIKELADKGISRRPVVNIHLNNELNLYAPQAIYFSYQMRYSRCVVYSQERLRIITEIIEKAGDKDVLIAVENIEHLEFIQENLKKNIPERATQIQTVSGEDEQLHTKLEWYKCEAVKGKVLISTKILTEGVNLPNIEVFIYAAGGKSEIRLIQWLGRPARAYKDFKEVEIHDFYDCGSEHLQDKQDIEKHSRKRIKIYKQEEIDFKLMYKHKNFSPVK